MGRDNKLIFRNSIYLYGRFLITMVVSLFTARIVLNQLGVDDYGTYNVVAGLITMFASLKSMFSSAIQRFYNFEFGQTGSSERVNEIFNVGFLLHCILAIVLVVIIEPFGIYMIKQKLIIPEDNHTIAHFIFQLNIVMMALSIIILPYDAMIVAKEKMNFCAGLSVFDALLKLLQAFSLIWLKGDKLLIYAICIFIISIINFTIELIYAKKNFIECNLKFVWDTRLFKRLASFAGWNCFGNTAYTLVNEINNIYLNLFCGVVANAARGIANQVRNVVQSVLANTLVAVRPQATQEYAKGNTSSFFKIVYFSSKTVFFFALCLCLPLIFYVDKIIFMWLGSVPEYSVNFIRVILVQIIIRSFHEPIDLIFKSTGNLKWYQLTSLFVAMIGLPIIYFLLRHGMSVITVFIGQCVMEMIELVVIVALSTREGLSLTDYLKKVVGKVFIILPLSSILGVGCYLILNKIWFLSAFVICIEVLFVEFSLGYDKDERKMIISMIKPKRI